MARRRCQFASLSAAVGSPLVTIVKRCKLHQVWKRTTEQYLVISGLRYAIISSRKNFGRLDVTAAQIGCGGGASRDPASQRSSGIDTSSVITSSLDPTLAWQCTKTKGITSNGGEANDNKVYEDDLVDYDEEVENDVDGVAANPSIDVVKKGYVRIHSSGFRDFLLKPELLHAI